MNTDKEYKQNYERAQQTISSFDKLQRKCSQDKEIDEKNMTM